MKVVVIAISATCIFLNGCTSSQARQERAYIDSSNAKSERSERGIKTQHVGINQEMYERAKVLFPEVAALIESADDAEKKVVYPKLTKAPPPVYPYIATLAPAEGEIWVGFVVEADGNVIRVEALVDPENSFAQAAINAVKQWKFKPGTIEGAPAQFMYTVPIRFSLD
jgi:TonB family protein